MDVPDTFRECPAFLEIAIRRVEPPPVGAHHAQVVIGDRAAVLVAAAAVRVERAFVPRHGLVQLTLDVGDDPEILFGTRAQRLTRASEVQYFEERLARVLQRPRGDVHDAERIERFSREHVVVDVVGYVIAPEAECAGLISVPPLVPHDGETAERLRQDPLVAELLCRRDRRFVALDRFGQRPRPFALARLLEQCGRRSERSAQARLTKRGHTLRSAGACP